MPSLKNKFNKYLENNNLGKQSGSIQTIYCEGCLQKSSFYTLVSSIHQATITEKFYLHE